MLMRKISFCLLLFYITAHTTFAKIDSEIFLEGATVMSIARDGDILWVATYGQGIYKYFIKEQKWENFSTKSGNLDNDLFYTIEVNKDYVWAGSAGGLFILTKGSKKWSKRKFAQGGQFGNWIRALKYDPSQDVLWIGRFRNITRLDVRKRRYSDINMMQGKDQKSNNIKVIEIDGDSLIWFGTESGVHRYEKKKMYKSEAAWKYITNKKRGFNEEGKTVSVSSFIFEGSKIWFGTDEFTSSSDPSFNVGGIYVHDRKLDWKKISQINGLADNGIYALGRTGNYIWAGVYSFNRDENIEQGKGLFLINRKTLRVKEVDLDQLNIRSSTFLTFHFDGEYMWIGSNTGLLRIRIKNPLTRLGAATYSKNG
jgi:ligand-binding sensor domain-containing protein